MLRLLSGSAATLQEWLCGGGQSILNNTNIVLQVHNVLPLKSMLA